VSPYYFSPSYLLFGSLYISYAILLIITVIYGGVISYPSSCNMTCCVALCGNEYLGCRFETTHPLIAARYLHSGNHCPQCLSTPLHHLVLLRSTRAATRVHMELLPTMPLPTLLTQSLHVSLSITPFLLTLDDPSVLALRLPPGNYSSLEVMYAAVPFLPYFENKYMG
jgi:hypothetical protein